MTWELSYDLKLSVPAVLAICTLFSSHSASIAWEPGTAETKVLAKYEWCSVTCRQIWVATLRVEKALTENIVFNLAGTVSSSFPSCLLSGCGHEIQAPHLCHYPVLVGVRGAFLLAVSHILWPRGMPDVHTSFIFLIPLVHLPMSI